MHISEQQQHIYMYNRALTCVLIICLPSSPSQALMNTVIDATKMYRSQFASSMQATQFNLPASLQLLPLFIIALLKSVSTHFILVLSFYLVL